jgi:integrase
MTYVAAQKRWIKTYRGAMYSVSCKQLGCEASKEASWGAANRWWELKQSDLEDAERTRQEDPEAQVRRQLDRAFGSLDPLDLLEAEGRSCQLRIVQTLQEMRGRPDQSEVLMALEKTGYVSDMIREFKGQGPPAGQSVGEQVAAWLAMLRVSVGQGQIDAGRYDSYARHIGVFRDWIGGDKTVGAITASKLEEYWTWLSGCVSSGRYSSATAKTMFMTVKQFVSRLAELDLIPLPGNIRSRRFRFNDGPRRIDRLSLAEVKSMLASCEGFSERTRLYVLLMLNCGMYQSDISDLGEDEVDFSAGTLTRARSKTARRMSEPAVTRYKLWPETLGLLKKHRARSAVPNERGSDRLLLTDDGKQLVRYWLEGEKMRRYDVVQSAFSRLWERLGWKKEIRALRKTSASELGAHPVYGAYARYFLAESPKGVTDRHYVQPSDEQFFSGLEWLRGRFLED